VKTAKTVQAGLVLPTSSLVRVALLNPTAGPAKVLLDPSIPTRMVLPVLAAVTFEAAATAEAEEAATVAALLAALATDSGKMVSTSQAHQT
jgi:hypothetical protein